MAWHVITYGGENKPYNYTEFLIDEDSDINTPPTEFSYSLGSFAHTAGFKKMWELNSNGDWVEIGGDS